MPTLPRPTEMDGALVLDYSTCLQAIRTMDVEDFLAWLEGLSGRQLDLYSASRDWTRSPDFILKCRGSLGDLLVTWAPSGTVYQVPTHATVYQVSTTHDDKATCPCCGDDMTGDVIVCDVCWHGSRGLTIGTHVDPSSPAETFQVTAEARTYWMVLRDVRVAERAYRAARGLVS